MSNRRKELPRITLRNLRPPYDEADGDYFYFVDADRQPTAGRDPFRPDARGFEPVNAWWLCEAATLAYSAPATVEATFKDRTPLQQFRAFGTRGGTECFVASNEDFAVVVFRGTEASTREGSPLDFKDIFLDIGTDADIRTSVFAEGANVHRGFGEAVDEVWERGGLGDYVTNLPSRTVWFTGHSLGAALATLAAARSKRLDGLYTYGSPRVGDAGFAAAFDRLMADRGLEYYRYVQGDDVVTNVPLMSLPPVVFFKHAGTLKHIDPGEHPLNFIPDAIDDHVPTLYATHIWNAYVDSQGA